MAKKIARLDFDLAGCMELSKLLANVALDVQAEVIGAAVAEAAKPVVRAIKRRVPVRYGNLKRSIMAVVRKKKKTGKAVAVVGPERGGRYKSGKRLNKKKDDLAGSDQPSRYAHLVEFGHKGRDGNRVAEKPFMRPGTTESMTEASGRMVVGFQKGLTKVLAKRVKKAMKTK